MNVASHEIPSVFKVYGLITRTNFYALHVPLPTERQQWTSWYLSRSLVVTIWLEASFPPHSFGHFILEHTKVKVAPISEAIACVLLSEIWTAASLCSFPRPQWRRSVYSVSMKINLLNLMSLRIQENQETLKHSAITEQGTYVILVEILE